ncbi:AraC family transcriptional regulator [Trinickia sp. NRRL B-1857]|uniref:AraC family transcriptional regulator n=1 Tax=Trinickia sp. NRRL B-1857 TaxID=3162879 RepID=UPI003D2BC715
MTSYAFHRQFLEPADTGERTFAHHYLLYASEGAFRLETDERSWLLPSHRAAFIRANTRIRVRVAAPATSASVLFDAVDNAFPSLQDDCAVFRVTPLIREMVLYAARWNEDSSAADPAAAPFFQSLGYVVSEGAAQPEALWFPRATSNDLRRALEFTLSSLAEPLSLADVATAASMSERTLNRRFAEELSMTWTEFLQRARVVHATEHVIDGRKSLATIAYDFGFASPSKFAHAFKLIHGETPRRYRERHKRLA